MQFSDVWNEIAIGTVLSVSDGRPPPSTNTSGVPYKAWKSHNFTGILKEKVEQEDWRYLRFELEPDKNGNIIGFTLAEGIGHFFERA